MKSNWNNYEVKLLKEHLFVKLIELNLNLEKKKNSDICSNFKFT